MSALRRGLYEVLITEALETHLSGLEDRLAAVRGQLREDAPKVSPAAVEGPGAAGRRGCLPDQPSDALAARSSFKATRVYWARAPASSRLLADHSA